MHSSIEETKDYCDDIIYAYSNNEFYYWVIVLKDSNLPIGRINVSQQSRPLEMVHISFMIGNNWWNKGYTTEALSVIVKFFFEEVGVNRIEGRNDPKNPSSAKVMIKFGFQYEVLLRQRGKNSFGFVDCTQYAMLAEDYFGREISDT